LWLRLASDGAIFYGMPERLVRYRNHPGQASRNTIQMLRSEIAVIEKHLRAPCLDARLKRERLRPLYRNLVRALFDEGRASEARRSLQRLLLIEKGGLTTLLQIIAVSAIPSRLNLISDHLYRVEASISYRIRRLITQAHEKARLLFAKRREH